MGNNDEEHGSARYGVFTGTVSVISDLGTTIAWAWKKVEELQAFDAQTCSLLIRFFREITRLEIWCQSMGYVLDSSSGTITRNLSSDDQHQFDIENEKDLFFVQMTLSTSQHLIKNIIELFQRIGPVDLQKVQELRSDLSHRTGTTTAAAGQDIEMGFFSQPPTYELMMDALRRIGLVRQPKQASEKVVEMYRGTLQAIDEDVRKLHEQNNGLERFKMNRQFDKLSRIVPAGFTHLQGSVDKLATIFDCADDEKDGAIRSAALNSILEMGDGSAPGAFGCREIDEDDLEDVEGSPYREVQARGILLYSQQTCLIEWNRNVKADTERKREQVKNRLDHLVCRLEIQNVQDFSLLRPVAYVELVDDSDTTFGLVYSLPIEFNFSKHVVVSLKDIFSRSRDNSGSVPALGKRYSLAAKLTKILRQFQTSQWLHQSFNSDNVLFVEQINGECNVTDPVITGFDFARQVTAGSNERKQMVLERDFYQHPLRRNKRPNDLAKYRYRAEFDIYSLGRVLLDISQWCVVGDDDFSRAMGELASNMGDTYTAAVHWCLGLDPSSPVREARLRGLADESSASLKWSADLIYAYDKNVRTRLARLWV
ncbi:uncharacterized protein FMAN_13126 [Fusarium mangiferae]|uniref:Protein kinase domain-containing protein n=1 Tax=Fusarium mangiferae TaxID=192010 RepID=A0A1L7T7W7_FUSMA|nr:uncharacterized protein FMAN_13126 [Fusarium mangiferae]CVK94800.1 uncharacterized protein FMAN_13126 [Fusarium mangiferae]